MAGHTLLPATLRLASGQIVTVTETSQGHAAATGVARFTLKFETVGGLTVLVSRQSNPYIPAETWSDVNILVQQGLRLLEGIVSSLGEPDRDILIVTPSAGSS